MFCLLYAGRGVFQTADMNRRTESAKRSNKFVLREARCNEPRFGPTRVARRDHIEGVAEQQEHLEVPRRAAANLSRVSIPSYQPTDHCDLLVCCSLTSPLRLLCFFLFSQPFLSPLSFLPPFHFSRLLFFCYILSSVTYMTAMFKNASSFTSTLDQWNVASVLY